MELDIEHAIDLITEGIINFIDDCTECICPHCGALQEIKLEWKYDEKDDEIECGKCGKVL